MFEITQEEIDIEAALVSLIDNEHFILIEEAILLYLCEQNAVGHQLDERAGLGVIGKAHLIADSLAEGRIGLLGDTCGDCPRGYTPRLCVADQTTRTEAEI